jgi:regulator of RNase E activity RraA
MNANDHGLVKNLTAAGLINPHRVVAFDVVEGKVKQATGPTDKVVGCSGVVGAAADGERIDVLMDRNRTLEAGAPFAQGDWLVADAQGRVVGAAPAAGATHYAIGQAQEASTAVGQLVAVHISKIALRG